jgi:hypothetical protein
MKGRIVGRPFATNYIRNPASDEGHEAKRTELENGQRHQDQPWGEA